MWRESFSVAMSRVRPQDRGGLKDHQYTSRKRICLEKVVSVAILYAQKRQYVCVE
jgi:hypothetical protein